MYSVAAVAYALSIFIDVSVYHFKYYIQDIKNLRHLLSLINIFQYSARGFVLIFIPIMAYVTETVRDMNEVWFITILSHFFVVLCLLPLFHQKFASFFSLRVIKFLNFAFGRSKMLTLEIIKKKEDNHFGMHYFSKYWILFITSYIAGFMFSVSITFLYYVSFYYPTKILTLSSMTQIINMFGSIILILFIDPKIMGSIDDGEGYNEVMVLTLSRVMVHITLVLILIFIR